MTDGSTTAATTAATVAVAIVAPVTELSDGLLYCMMPLIKVLGGGTQHPLYNQQRDDKVTPHSTVRFINTLCPRTFRLQERFHGFTSISSSRSSSVLYKCVRCKQLRFSHMLRYVHTYMCAHNRSKQYC
jgi:hypothetical protein